MKTKLVAFYLPQYHPTSENNRFWGEGFTEWKFVARARPLFRYHYQPRIPGELGFYDLRMPEILQSQVELAKDHGIDAFCFYFYYFNGKRLLYKPIEHFLRNKGLKFEYCLCWANENWTRRWDGADHYILLKQDYILDDMKNLIHFFIEHFKEDRYLRYQGKPVLLIYRIKDIPMWNELSYLWREECYRHGIGDIHIAGVWGVKDAIFLEPPSRFGLDSYVIFPPHGSKSVDAKSKVVDLIKSFSGTIYDYDEVIEHDLERFKFGYEFPFHRGIMLNWDNSPRVNDSSRIFVGFTPLRFAYWLRKLLKTEIFFNSNEESLVFINAWNEWGEGTYLEPDERFGRTTLRLVKLVKEEFNKNYNLESIFNLKLALKKDNNNYIQKLNIPNHYSLLKGFKEPKKEAINLLIIAHYVSSKLFGGERSLLELLKCYDELDNFNIYVAVNSLSNEWYINEIKKHTCGIFLVDYKQWLGRRSLDVGISLQFADILATYSIDIVYANTIVIFEPSVIAKKLNRLSITHVREIISQDPYLAFEIGYTANKIKNFLYNRSDILICNSSATMEEYKEFDWKYYLPNIVDLSLLNKETHMENNINLIKENNKVVFGTISNNTVRKGILNVIELANMLLSHSEKTEIWVIGPETPFITYLKEKFTESNINFVKFLGYVNNPYQIISQMDVLLSLSDFAESFGRTVAEAHALGKPVIAFDRGAIKEIVVHEKTGFLAKYKDIEEVAKYCIKFIENPSLIYKMGERAKEAIKKYNYSNIKKLAQKMWSDIFQKANLYAKKKIEIKTSIIIPTYNASEELALCLEFLFKYTKFDENTELIIIDDASSYPEVFKILKEYEKHDHCRIIYHLKNLGYTKTINEGIKLAEGRDVVLLNSDTIPTPLWLEGLRATAYLNDKIGTVTAMSDNAGYFSFPELGKPNPKPEGLSYEEYALRIIENCFDLEPVEVPTGNGFCMYIKRDLINDIGLFDEEAFPFGYGEENDFCMRALRKGWINVITPWAFMYHHKSASFGQRRDELAKKAIQVITSRYPDYTDLVKIHFNSEKMNKLRERVKAVREFYLHYVRER